MLINLAMLGFFILLVVFCVAWCVRSIRQISTGAHAILIILWGATVCGMTLAAETLGGWRPFYVLRYGSASSDYFPVPIANVLVLIGCIEVLFGVWRYFVMRPKPDPATYTEDRGSWPPAPTDP